MTVLCLLMAPTLAQKTHQRLERQLRDMTKDFHGRIGIHIKDLRNGKTVSIDADTLFPTASIVKVPILLGIMDRIRKGELSYHQKIAWADTIRYDPGEDIIAYLKPGSPIELSKAIMLMMTISDNNASLMLQGLAGTGTAINRLMDSLGYPQTRVNSRTPGREAARSVFGWGQTTPREMARVFEDLALRRLFDTALCDRMLRIMGRQYWDEEALASVPPDVFVASKNGAVNASRSEVLYVQGRHPYILSVFTKENADKSWEADNEAWVLTRRISALVWQYLGK
jgi:beta-lactamase class A